MAGGPRKLIDSVASLYPDLLEPAEAIRAGHISVDGRIVMNPASVVGPRSNVVLKGPAPLRGEAKLRGALETFRIAVEGRVALDAGAAAGGFTRVLLERGARRVYAVDVGHGQLLGSLRQDERIVNLEATNLAHLSRETVPETIEVVTLDLSYLSLTAAVPQLGRISLAPGVDLVALVKPMFELQLPRPPEDRPRQEEALARAVAGIERAGWRVIASMDSPVLGGRGAVEFLVHATAGPEALSGPRRRSGAGVGDGDSNLPRGR